ncbi:hypothetical protein U8527_20570 [Kordia algicida OT-1]|uniref:Uncharacterized protein n=1 Tax=Kordia algicida OT-1 TaxID=391587 RepID=A9DKT3_9FLAO|nr:hypothetical protein [Kordia algicida]EDP98396.1 hypothetical protein KAOT1_14302 [Kordia algicida OT-1]
MKKQSFKSLKLNKKTVSNLEQKSLKGGVILTAGWICHVTRGDCDFPTVGHDDGSICISKDPDAWCGGR